MRGAGTRSGVWVWSILLHTKKLSPSHCISEENGAACEAVHQGIYVMLHEHTHSVKALPLMTKSCMQTQVRLHAAVSHKYYRHTGHFTYLYTHTNTRALRVLQYTFPVSHNTRPFAHTETNTYYTLTVNLTPCSNAEGIVPGLEDIKSLDYPIKSYFAPSPTHAKSAEQTIPPWSEGAVIGTTNYARNKSTQQLYYCFFTSVLTLKATSYKNKEIFVQK